MTEQPYISKGAKYECLHCRDWAFVALKNLYKGDTLKEGDIKTYKTDTVLGIGQKTDCENCGRNVPVNLRDNWIME